MDPNVLVGTVEGFPEIGDVQKDLAAAKIKKVWLMPFMSVAGDHAQNDMAGDEDDSWKSVLTKAGFECRAALKGLAAYPQVRGGSGWITWTRRSSTSSKGVS